MEPSDRAEHLPDCSLAGLAAIRMPALRHDGPRKLGVQQHPPARFVLTSSEMIVQRPELHLRKVDNVCFHGMRTASVFQSP